MRRLDWRDVDGTRLVVAAFGILCGITGVIAGLFEARQGGVAPSGYVISTIGSNYVSADDFTYFAVTVVPNMFLTGMLAVIVSCLVIIWSVRFVHKKNGALILLGLSVVQMLVGGGWVIDLSVVSCILATRIGKPLNWWRSNLPAGIRLWLARHLAFSLAVYAVISSGMLVLTVLGVNDARYLKPMEPLAAAMFVPMLLMILGGLAHDIRRQMKAEGAVG
jgi:hypothetical protein